MHRAIRRDPMTLLLGCLMALLVAYIWWQTNQLSGDLRAANQARDQLATQVQQLGETPVAGPPGSRGLPGQSVPGPAGSPGPSGAPGADGVDGSRGPSGKTGKAGKAGAAGNDGSPGAAGADGVTQTGAPGSAGEAGPPGAQGEPGPAGANGRDGLDGADGKDGQTCPTGYSLQPPSTDPDALICRRDSAPTQPAPSPSLPALDPTRRQDP
ncbi:collagen-like protein (plasmid) [Streptomyces sp. NBC_01259]|uniref:collagen-like protein n=1 Tax=Streptomyces sp. NBC_01259 TaxID=2903800 RepID=UPI002F90B75B